MTWAAWTIPLSVLIAQLATMTPILWYHTVFWIFAAGGQTAPGTWHFVTFSSYYLMTAALDLVATLKKVSVFYNYIVFGQINVSYGAIPSCPTSNQSSDSMRNRQIESFDWLSRKEISDFIDENWANTIRQKSPWKNAEVVFRCWSSGLFVIIPWKLKIC